MNGHNTGCMIDGGAGGATWKISITLEDRQNFERI
jgi:hypothetical protein